MKLYLNITGVENFPKDELDKSISVLCPHSF